MEKIIKHFQKKNKKNLGKTKVILTVLVVLGLVFSGVFFYLETQNVTVAIVSGSTTVSSLIAEVDVTVKNVSQLDYILMEKGKPKVTSSRPKETQNVVNLTISFTLKTPTGKELSFEPLKIGEAGEHNFELIIGPNEGLDETGEFKLTIKFHLKVTTPTGMLVAQQIITITVEFTVPPP